MIRGYARVSSTNQSPPIYRSASANLAYNIRRLLTLDRIAAA
jgi:hypothetical protein